MEIREQPPGMLKSECETITSLMAGGDWFTACIEPFHTPKTVVGLEMYK